MFAVVSPQKIHLPPGSVLKLPGDWNEYKSLCERLADRSSPRIKYRPGEILLMAPLPEHGRKVSLIADVVKVLLDFLGKEYESFTPITMELPSLSGVEPDYCFYIDNWETIAGKDRIDWSTEPPPDLAIEIDVTSYTDINDYLPCRLPEVWLFKKNQLKIYNLENEQYLEKKSSRYFPDMEVIEIVNESLQIAYSRNTSAAIRELKRKLNSQ
ncbi:MAG: Uma2 family endonuclease [Cyanobacteria bacterium P01_A01_bin.45]